MSTQPFDDTQVEALSPSSTSTLDSQIAKGNSDVGSAEKAKRQTDMVEELEDRFGSMPSLPPSITCGSAIYQFTCTTSRFLNSFAASADARLTTVSQRLSELEVQMDLLESKLGTTAEDPHNTAQLVDTESSEAHHRLV
eukprot:scaffold340048_cov59-Attheya_sp.AAC.2